MCVHPCASAAGHGVPSGFPVDLSGPDESPGKMGTMNEKPWVSPYAAILLGYDPGSNPGFSTGLSTRLPCIQPCAAPRSGFSSDLVGSLVFVCVCVVLVHPLGERYVCV